MGEKTKIQTWLQRLRAGDDGARDEVIRHASERLRRRAHQLFRRNDRLRRHEQTDDVLQVALVRLHKSLKDVHPESVPQLIGLAARHIRLAIVDLARHHFGPLGQGKHHHTDGQPADEAGGSLEKATSEPQDLYDWVKFHNAFEALPEDEKQVFDLIWYKGLKQVEVAEVLGVSEKTIQRQWLKIRTRFATMQMPE